MDQRYALVSFVSHEDKMAMKIYGCYPDEDTATKMCKELMSKDDSYDIFLCMTNTFVPVNPTREQVNEENYRDNYLQDLMKGYETAQAEAQAEFEARKRDMLAKQAEEQLAIKAEKAKEEKTD